MKKAIISFLALSLLMACNFQAKKEPLVEDNLLAPLDSGVVYYHDKSAFDTLIHLKGEKVLDDSINSINTVNYIFSKNGQLILFDHNSEKLTSYVEFRYFSLPDLQFIKSGKDSVYLYAHLVPSSDTAIVSYLWTPYNRQLYKYDGITTEKSNLKLPLTIRDQVSSLTHIGGGDFLYVNDSSIIHATNTVDSVSDRKVHDLNSLDPHLGKLAVNVSKNRMVYAYSYYQVILVMDLDAKTVKTIDYQNGNYHYDYRHRYMMGGGNPNPKFYCGVFAGDDYFYALYWGYSDIEFVNRSVRGWRWSISEQKYIKTDQYQPGLSHIVEQYDWNGNPVRRYLLEGDPSRGDGAFVVDEKNQRFYLLSSECYDSFMMALRCERSLMMYSFANSLSHDNQ